MQWGYLKIVAGIILTIIVSQHAVSQDLNFRLKTADSLFQAKQYTQSLEHYEQILKQDQYTPSMLLKMAFIQEGLLRTGQALYYLNLYYIATRDKTALEKMDELAQKYNLEGYEHTENDKFFSFYQDYHLQLGGALAALMLLMLSLSIYTRLRLKKRPIVSFVMLCVFAIALVANFYYAGSVSTGIVANASTYVMSGPSSAASVVEIIGDGHRVTVLGQKDVWTEIRWNENIGYVKQNALLPVKL